MDNDAKIKKLRQEVVELKTQLYNTKQTLRGKRSELRELVREGRKNILHVKPHEINKAINDAIKQGLDGINEIKVDGEILSPDDSDKIGKMTFEIMKNLGDVFKKTGDILEKSAVNKIHKPNLEEFLDEEESEE